MTKKFKNSDLIGKTITEVRALNDDEAEVQGWEYAHCVVIILDDGTKLFPSRDPEGNGPGALFGERGEEMFYVFGG